MHAVEKPIIGWISENSAEADEVRMRPSKRTARASCVCVCNHMMMATSVTKWLTDEIADAKKIILVVVVTMVLFTVSGRIRVTAQPLDRPVSRIPHVKDATR